MGEFSPVEDYLQAINCWFQEEGGSVLFKGKSHNRLANSKKIAIKKTILSTLSDLSTFYL